MTDIVVPSDLWDTEDEGVLFLWVYPDGAVVEKGKLIAELTVEKAQLELTAPASGRLKILVQPETIIRKGQVLGRIERALKENDVDLQLGAARRSSPARAKGSASPRRIRWVKKAWTSPSARATRRMCERPWRAASQRREGDRRCRGRDERRAVRAWIESSAERLGGIDIFVHNVTASPSTPGMRGWDLAYSTDIWAAVRGVETALPHLKKSKIRSAS